MFPGVNGFHWSFGHILFLGLFFAVALAIAGTVLLALLRVLRDFRSQRACDLCWHVEFEELPEPERRCRHELSGRVEQRTCPNAFECGRCSEFAKLAELPAAGEEQPLGLSLPADRLYHRGHTWVLPQPDGTYLVGLDDLAERLVGDPDTVQLPTPGTQLERNSTAWRMAKKGREIQVRAPISGTVIERGGADQEWYLRLKPQASDDLRHLLRGVEVSAWMRCELERLQLQLRQPGAAPSLADGGVLMSGLMEAMPDADWETVLGATFLEP